MNQNAKRYSNIKYSLAIIDTAYLLILLFAFVKSGISKFLAQSLVRIQSHYYLEAALYSLIIYLAYYLLTLPLNFYRSYVIEHKFSLSNQKIKDWLGDQLKELAVTYLIAVIMLEIFYYILKSYPRDWWLWVSFCWIFLSLVLAKIFPIIIIPLFFKYKKLSNEPLRERIINLAGKMKVKILDVFEIDFSKKTLKGNAALVGQGGTRRVILADTLKNKYTYEEIEVILAHEFAHHKLRHISKLIIVNASGIILSFYLVFKTSNFILSIFGLTSLSDIASLPVIIIYFVIFGLIIQPLENYISRSFERDADSLAIRATGMKASFISMIEKLEQQNLADRNPHPLIKFFFFNHPPISERIGSAEKITL